MLPLNSFNWDASTFFRRLAKANKLARLLGMRFHLVSSLDGFHSALSDITSAKGFICVSDTSQGSLSLDNSPRTRRVKTVFLALRHAVDNDDARRQAFDRMREVFRQFMSVLNLEKTKLAENCVYVDPDISFTEISRYFFSGCACAFFQIAVDNYTSLEFDADEWDDLDLADDGAFSGAFSPQFR